MNLVSLEAVGHRFAERTVLDGITLGIDDGDRIGVIGLNGSGKSTLLRVIAGDLAPDRGRVVHGSSVRVAYLGQDPGLPPGANPVAAVLDAGTDEARLFDELEAAQAAVRDAPTDQTAQERLASVTRAMDAADAWSLERRARAVLDRLGLGGVTAPCGTLSGGQRKRVALARALVSPAELLVLDEPTNHLDVEVIEWLEGELAARAGAVVLVTHDRYLLDRVATRIVEVVGGGIRSGYGSYQDYLIARAERDQQARAAERKRANLARTELDWLRRGPKARGTKAKHRVEQARDLLERREHTEADELTLDLPARRIGSKVVNLHNVGKRYGDQWVLRGVEHRLDPGARVGIVGPNGSGKTTLLGLIAGRIEPDEGSVRVGETVHAGWYGQDPAPLPPRTRTLDAVSEVVHETNTVDGLRVSASELLERFLFTAAQQKAYVSELSGGERRRLELLRVLADAPNLLLLDEPTNDLDLDTLAVLEGYLDRWPGAIVVASHDRYFLDRVCDDLFSLEADGSMRHHPGGWEAYRQARAAELRAARAEHGGRRGGVDERVGDRGAASGPDHGAAGGPNDGAARGPNDGAARGLDRGAASGPDRGSGRVDSGEVDPALRKRTYNEERELGQLGDRIAELEERRRALSEELQRAGDDYQEAARVGAELAAVDDELATAETRWLELEMIGEHR